MSAQEDVRIGARLRKVRERLGLTLEDVASRSGFNNYQTLASIEKGERAIKVSELTKLSGIYCRDFWFFLAEEEPAEMEIQFAWRKRQPGREYNGVEASIRELVENYRLLEEINGLRKKDIDFIWESNSPLTSRDQAKQKAAELVQKLDLGCWPAVNLPQKMEEQLGIKPIFWNLGEYGSGACALSEDSIAIIVNADECEGRRNFSLAHELFHIYASKIYPFKDFPCQESTNEVEKLADAFAAALLMPKDSVEGEFLKIVHEGRFSLFDLIPIAQNFKVSNIALAVRLKNLGRIRPDTVDRIAESPEFAEVNRMMRGEENAAALTFSPRFVSLGLKALRDGKISKGKFCRIFGISRSRFGDFIGHRGFSEELLYETEEQTDYS